MNSVLRAAAAVAALILLANPVLAQWAPTNGPYGGTVYDLETLDGYVFAGATGGVYRSSDGGASWMMKSNGLPAMFVVSLAVVGHELFVGFGNGRGVYRSSDFGETWNREMMGLNYSDVVYLGEINDRAVASTNDNGGLYRFNVETRQWDSLGMVGVVFSDFAENPDYAFASSNSGVLRTSDHGDNWTILADGLTTLESGSIFATDTKVFVGTYGGGMFESADNGEHWIHSQLPTAGVRDMEQLGGVILAATYNGVFASQDGGILWTNIGPQVQITSIAVVGGSIIASDYDGVWRALAIDGQWSRANEGLASQSVGSLAGIGNILFAGASGGIYSSSDDGQSWNLKDTSGNINSFLQVGNVLYAGVLVSRDNGDTWDLNNDGLLGSSILSLTQSGDHIVAGTSNGVFRLLNGGNSWQATLGMAPYTYVLSIYSAGGFVFAGTLSGLYRSEDDGATWTEMGGILSGEYISAIAGTDNRIFAGTSSGVFWSDDWGMNWVQATGGLPATYIRSVLISRRRVFVSIWNGIFVSADSGESWESISAGLGGLATGPLAVSEHYIFASTLYSAVWRRPLSDFVTDTDEDGVEDEIDLCPATAIPESVPTVRLNPNSWALVDGDTTFDTVVKGKGKNPVSRFSLAQTGGCSCEQIVFVTGSGRGHLKNGCSTGLMEKWVASVSTSIARFGADLAAIEVAEAGTEFTFSAIPTEYALEGNYPNPFNPVTTIRFDVPEAAAVGLSVFDVMGREVRVLVQGTLEAGRHEASFDGAGLPSGTYLYRLTTPAGVFSKTMVLLK